MNDEKWDSIDYFLKFTEPIVDMLRSADIDGPKLHTSMIYLISGQSNFFDTIYDILVARWNKSNTPLHCMAHSLVLKYYHESWLQGENGIIKLNPNEDSEISLNRVKCFQRYFKDSNEMKQVSLEYGSFCSGSGYFSEPHVIETMMYEVSLSWWTNHGVSAPLLQQLAYKNWSTYSLIHNIKRNKLATSRAKDLVFLHYNLWLLSRKKEKYINGRSKYWDVGGDRFDIDETTNDLTELSIDEPQIEGVILRKSLKIWKKLKKMWKR
ncbi:hypothetical protein R3W88_019259 [Solanum pinnatisectum]|uniref:HAT C-terminal dimerisation domain-containing protein n=1 Tax=Solanum pinnatisectum TaxID=50273 RepID=A0AAV9KMS8_9SOLN|nr:hypothetical protein R3W88_019259 [Solanum pinnatisectum]